jgi:phosphoglycolate phosphatase/pyrophosphatase PpaX
MLQYRCLVLDHDDTVVQSEKTIGYPFFREIIHKFRPGWDITLEEYLTGCHELGFANMCRQIYHFTEEELLEEFLGWKAYVRTHIPEIFPGIDRIILRQKEEGGLLFVVSHSGEENISRDYQVHFGIQPDGIYGWDLPEEKRKPSTYALEDIMEKYQITKDEILVVDDMKLAWDMANKVEVKTAFAAWGKLDFPALCEEMESLCDYTFLSVADLEKFLFDN